MCIRDELRLGRVIMDAISVAAVCLTLGSIRPYSFLILESVVKSNITRCATRYQSSVAHRYRRAWEHHKTVATPGDLDRRRAIRYYLRGKRRHRPRATRAFQRYGEVDTVELDPSASQSIACMLSYIATSPSRVTSDLPLASREVIPVGAAWMMRMRYEDASESERGSVVTLTHVARQQQT